MIGSRCFGWLVFAFFGERILFSVEIMLRCLAVGPVAYVCGEGWAWHWLDLVAVPRTFPRAFFCIHKRCPLFFVDICVHFLRFQLIFRHTHRCLFFWRVADSAKGKLEGPVPCFSGWFSVRPQEMVRRGHSLSPAEVQQVCVDIGSL